MEEKEIVHCPSCMERPEEGWKCQGRDIDCLCHKPLGVSVGEVVKGKDVFGQLPKQ